MRPSPLRSLLLLAFLASCDGGGAGGGGGPTEPPPPAGPPPPAVLTLDTPVEGSLKVGEAARYVFQAPPQGTVAIFLDALGIPGQSVRLTVTQGMLREEFGAGTGGPTPWAAIRVDLQPGAETSIQVYASHVGGPFRLLVRTVDRLPEAAPAAIPWETWVRERIDNVYDVDDFHFDVAAGDEIVIFQDIPQFDVVEISLHGPGGGAPLWSAASNHPRFEPRVLPAGRYRIQVARKYLTVLTYTGEYRFMVYRVDPRPEHADPDLQPLRPVEDVIHLRGDRDEYFFTPAPDTDYALFFGYEGEVPPGEPVHRVVAEDPATGQVLGSPALGPFDTIRAGRSGRFRPPASRPVRVTVSGSPGFLPSGALGRYRLELFPIDRGPESVPARIAIDQVVTGESIDLYADIDEFVFEGTAGSRVVVQTEAPTGSMVDLLHPSGDTLARIHSYYTDAELERHASDRIVLPVTGTYRVRIWYDFQSTRQPGPSGPGPYRFQVARLELGPEVASSSVALGVPVDREALYPVNDLDVFRFEGTAGDTLELRARTLEYRPSRAPIRLTVRRADTDAYVHTLFARDLEARGSFVLPVTGEYRIEVESVPGPQPRPYFGPYRFVLDRAP